MERSTTTVLVVDDEPAVADLYRTWLSRRYDVQVAGDGRTALDRLDGTVDVVLLDRELPGMDGDEVLEELRDRGTDCRVAMVTATAPDYDVVGMGFDDYVVKPTTRDELLDVVERLVALNEYDRYAREYFTLASKKVALQKGNSPEELAESDEFARLQRRIREAELRAQTTLDGMDKSEFVPLYRTLDESTREPSSDATSGRERRQ